ncbi:MAG TPA: cysteine--tRNA ligase, partial [Propionibacteriaceae bacterium]|nr:cysteine--tRNA ligase [Propionibacteriaceae bacterium]
MTRQAQPGAASDAFRLYDTATQSVRHFEPVVSGRVSIYHCGLTVQSGPHLGHIRKEVVFDVLRRWLTWCGYEVTVIANITDIDDKILIKSAEAGAPWFALAYRFERELHDAYAALGCLPPTYEPRATGHIPEMIEMIKVLIERGHAYPAPDSSGDVYFDVKSWPAYGSLSHQNIDDMEPAGDSDPRGKRDPRDFALWKGHKDTEPETASWVTPWGRGRPGWHLECSAMAGKYLGAEFDIHGGGLDLRFPHHENELAQSRAAGQRFTRYWMHNALVTTAGEKMSKSLGNSALVSEVIKRFPARAVRLYLLQPHYRSPIEYSDTAIAESVVALERIDNFVRRAGDVVGVIAEHVPQEFSAAMNDDLGTPAAVAVLHNVVREGNQALEAGETDLVATRLAEVLGMLAILGLDADSAAWER